MNIEKLEAILHDMRNAKFRDPDQAALVAGWADRIADAITDHLVGEVGRLDVLAPALAGAPGGHGWDGDETPLG